jgi:hypothetical protein
MSRTGHGSRARQGRAETVLFTWCRTRRGKARADVRLRLIAEEGSRAGYRARMEFKGKDQGKEGSGW